MPRLESIMLNRFIENVRQMDYKEFWISTDDNEFGEELKEAYPDINILIYTPMQPVGAEDKRIWTMTQGRRVLQDTFLKYRCDWFLSLDADMIYDNDAVDKLKRHVGSCKIIQNAYLLRHHIDFKAVGFGLGCSLIHRSVLEKVEFRCKEYSVTHVIEEGNMFEFDATMAGYKVKKGNWININHYYNQYEYLNNDLISVPLTANQLIRFTLLLFTQTFKFDFSRTLFKLKNYKSFYSRSKHNAKNK